MKKTVTANLNQTVFTFEEDAFEKLDTYTDSIHSHFAHNADKDEIVSDIEARISEKLQESLVSGRTVVQLKDVEAVIASMGSVKDIAGDEDDKTETTAKTSVSKKLFRDPDHAVIGGVASGIANYFGTDPAFIRFLFIITLFFGGFGVIAYLACLIAMPEAKSATDKMQMYGEPINIKNIEANVKKTFKDVNDEESTVSKIVLLPFRIIGKLFKVASKIARPLLQVLIIMTGIGLILGGIGSIAGLSVFGTLMLTHAYIPYVEPSVVSLLSQISHPIFMISLMLSAIVPCFLVVLGGIGLIRMKNPLSLYGGISLMVVWITSLALMGFYGVSISPQIEQYVKRWETIDVSSKQTVPNLASFTKIDISDIRTVKVNQGSVASVTMIGDPEFTNTLSITSENGRLTMKTIRANKICITCEATRPVEVIITVPQLTEFTVNNIGELTIDDVSQPAVKGTIGSHIKTYLNQFNVKELELNLAHRAGVDLTGTGSNAVFQLDSDSRLTADKFLAKTITITAASESKATLNAATITVDQADDADIQYVGKPKVIKSVASPSAVLSP